MKYFNELKDFERKLPTLTKKEYEKLKTEVHYKIQLMPTIIKSINEDCTKIILTKDYENNVDPNVHSKLEKVSEILTPKISEVQILISTILEKEKTVSLKLRNLNISESKLDDSLSLLQNRSDHLRESRIIMREVVDNQRYLEKRKEELEDIKK
jgi:hypothetical protein